MLARLVDVEARGLLRVERAQAHPGGPPALELHVPTDHVHQGDAVHDLADELLGDLRHGGPEATSAGGPWGAQAEEDDQFAVEDDDLFAVEDEESDEQGGFAAYDGSWYV